MTTVFSLAALRRVVVAAAVTLAASTAMAEQPADYSTQVPLTLSGEGPWYRLEVPMALRLAARFGDLRDLRVFNAEGEAQAYALTLGSAEQSESSMATAVKWFPLYSAVDATSEVPQVRVERTTTGTIVEVGPQAVTSTDKQQVLRGWLLDASAIDAPLNKLSLDWTSEQDGFQRFTIEASDDLQTWSRWDDGQIARLAFADDRIEQRDTSLPGQRARYLRLLWLAPQKAPVLISAELYSTTHSSVAAPLSWSEALPTTLVKAGEYNLDLPVPLPLELLRVELAQANTLAPVSVSTRRESKDSWQPLARGLLYRLPENGKDVIHDELQLPGQWVQHLRLQVDSRGGGLGKNAPTVRVGLRATQLVFLARGTPPYVLALGNADGKANSLPLTTLIPGYDDKRLAKLGVAKAGAPLAVAPSAQAAAPVASVDWQRYGLWAVLLVGVGLLVGMALSLLRAQKT
ncbi:DUF3999 domain-containing protein [Pseudomonas sp. GV071]|uniref:DUF3999 domain-containing protein n=1 Tax=Pseudomonas sp. GV071 TaxID=2135754 RepID=UPI000D373924|nr:DUF3999 domain-containing protein [Pseudomonas sp. GV071]PTQ71173.1 uncharacterized protein DUF3999 [Pseudomonas sp. GV071]